MGGRTLKETIFGRPFYPGHVSAPLGIFSRTFCTMSVSELREDVSQAKGTGSLGSSSWQLLSDLGTRASGPMTFLAVISQIINPLIQTPKQRFSCFTRVHKTMAGNWLLAR